MRHSNLKQALDILSDFCEQWNLKVNPAKSQVIIFSKAVLPDGLSFRYRKTKLVIVDRFKYLGIRFTTKGSWEINTETLCGQARKAIMSLRQRFHQYEFSPHEKYRLFNQLVEPILSYGAEVWGHVKANDMELLHRKFLKEILCVRSSTENESVYHVLGTIPLRPRRLIRMVSFWAGVAGPDSHKLSSEVYRLQRVKVQSEALAESSVVFGRVFGQQNG